MCEQSLIKKLDLGCGLEKVLGADGLDFKPLPTVKYVHDMNIFPYPIEDNTYDEIYCSHILEHVNDLIKVMEEIYRIGRNNCKVFIRGPHCSCNSTVWIDPTHKRGLSIGTFRDYFSPEAPWSFYSSVNFKIDTIRLNYIIKSSSRISRVVNKFLSLLANLNQFSQKMCERIWAYWVGGFEEIEVVLRVVKEPRKEILIEKGV